MYEGLSDADLPIEAIVAHNMGDEDWEELTNDNQLLAFGCSRKATHERDRYDRFEPEPITIKALITRPRHH